MYFLSYNKVIFVSNYAADYAGNFIASLFALAKQLRKAGNKVIFIFPNEAKLQNWEVNLSEFKVIYSGFNYEALIKCINDEISDNDKVIIHTHFMSSMFSLRLKKVLSNKDKIVFQQHMAVKFGLKQIIKGIILKEFGFNNTTYIGVSPAVYDDICREVGSSKSRLVTNALDLERLDFSNNKRASRNNILIFGSDYKRKGVDLAIKAIKKAQLESKVKLFVVTHTPTVAKRITQDEFKEIPSFVKFIEPTTNVTKLYRSCFLFLSPSRSEAFGYSVIEAAYSGLRVIATDVPGQNILKNVPHITWVNSNNVEQLSNAIFKVYGQSKEKVVDVYKTRKIIEKDYSLERWVNQIMDIYNE